MPLYDVEVYYDDMILTIATVTADSREEAEILAVKAINFRTKQK